MTRKTNEYALSLNSASTAFWTLHIPSSSQTSEGSPISLPFSYEKPDTQRGPPTATQLRRSAQHAAAAAKSLQSCPTLCNPIDGSPPGSPHPWDSPGKTLEWVAISFSNAWKWKVKGKSLSGVRLFADPKDCSPPGSSVHGIFQARVLEWGAIAFSTTQHSDPQTGTVLRELDNSQQRNNRHPANT